MLAHTNGTEGSGGHRKREDNTNLEPVLPDDAIRVSFGADYLFAHRTISDFDDKFLKVIGFIYRNYKIENPTFIPHQDRYAGHWVQDIATGAVNIKQPDDDWKTAIEKAIYRKH